MVSPRIQDMIVAGKAASALRAASVEEGMVPLRLYGWTKVYEGVTTIEEVARVTAAELEMAEE
jgi:type II secretory ATPase GspE/PulE/Tfp pilus assembly ATPase PilB-like protein